MHHRDARSYYEDPSAGSQFSPGQYATPGGDYTSYDYQQNSAQYYNSSPHSNDGAYTNFSLVCHHSSSHLSTVSPSHPYYRSMTPAIHSHHRYSNSNSSRDYYSSSGILNSTSPLQQPYSNQAYYSNQYPSPSSETRSPSQTQFIPTPSEMAHSYSNYPPPPQTVSTQYGPGLNGYSNPVPVLPQPHNPLRPSRISTGRPRTASGATTSPTSATSPSGERFPCEKCGKTFSRSHDRKRHHETQHLPTPVIHRCRYCEKEFSR
jgi:hypothetical protein